MLTQEDKQYIQQKVKNPNSAEFVDEVISQFSEGGVSNILYLIDKLSSLAELSLSKTSKEANRLWFANTLLIDDHVAKAENEAKQDQPYIASMIHVCASHFPKGLTGSESLSERTYFNEMIDLLKSKPKSFDYTKRELWTWAKHCEIQGWLTDIIHDHIDLTLDSSRVDNILRGEM